MPRSSAGNGTTGRAVRVGTALALALAGLLAVPASAAPSPAAVPAGRILFADTELYAINADGTNRTRLADLGDGWGIHDITADATGTRIAFETVRDGAAEIWAVDPDGSDLARLTTGGGNEQPAFSPDGTKIVYVRHGDIWTMNADGSEATRLTTDHNSHRPTFSSDGERIAFEGPSALTAMDADGDDVDVLVDGGEPAFSPDGTKIAFIGYDDGEEVYVMDADGTDVVRVTPPSLSGGDLGQVTFSPDGTRLAVESEGDEALFVMGADGSGPTRLTDSDSRAVWLSGQVPPAPVTPTVAVAASPATVKVGSRFSVAGRHRPALAEYANVKLQRYTADGWTTIDTAETSRECCGARAAASKYQFTVQPDWAGAWKLRVIRPAVGALPQVTSPTLTVHAVPNAYAVTLARSPAAAVDPLAPVTFSGSVTPAAPGGFVALQRYLGAVPEAGAARLGGGEWETVERKALAANSTFRFTTHPDLAAITLPYRVRADAKPGKVAAGGGPVLDVTTKHGPAITQVAAGGAHTCALNAGGAVMCWGKGGRLGDGGTAGSTVPVRVKDLSRVTAIAAGDRHTCAIAVDVVKCWGEDVLGNGTKADSTVPVAVTGLGDGIETISAGDGHTCVRSTPNKLSCWGSNDFGQLGDGTTAFAAVPVEVTGLTDVGRFSAGGRHTCAVASGALKCWGANEWGQLGDGAEADDYTADSSRDSSVPVAVTGLGSGIRSVSAGGAHTCALTTAGAVLCWGSGGMLTAADEEHAAPPDGSAVPQSVTGLTSGVATISAGRYQTCARTNLSTAKCWGYSQAGGTDYQGGRAAAPAAIEGLGSGIASLDSGGAHGCAVTTAGAVRCWGVDVHGQLGLGPWGRDSETAGNVVGEQ